MMSARSDPSRRKMKLFSATGPTVNMRTSMGRRLSRAGLLAPLTAAGQSGVGEVAQRHVDGERERTHHDALRDVLLHDRDEDDEDHGGERGAVERAPPRGRTVQAVLAPLLGERPALDLRAALGALGAGLGRLAGAPGALDRTGL